jgi:polysaccharide biosynthesis protein PslG
LALISNRQSLIALLLLFLAGCGRETAVFPTPSPTPAHLPTALMGSNPVVPHFNSPDYGIHTAFWWQPAFIERDLDLAAGLGFTYVKQKFPWRDLEGEVKGFYDWYRPDIIVTMAAERGLKLLVRLDQQPLWSVRALPDDQITANQPPVNYQDFADYCGALASRYKGRIAAYQVWNEPNLSREWGERSPNPAEYTALLRVCYEAIKAADPDAIVITAGLAPTGTQPPLAMPDADFLQGMYDAGAAAYFDVLGLNAPGFKAPPEIDPALAADPQAGFGGQRFFAFRHVGRHARHHGSQWGWP